MNIPIFPLPIFLLPQGITRLKIFEQRYLNMVKIATKENGFGILFDNKDNNENHTNPVIASWVDIINFNQNKEGILQIDVQCKSLITLTDVDMDKNNLMWATANKIPHWQPNQHDDLTIKLGEMLLSFFEQNSALFTLYNQQFIDQPNWIISRWLELLPIDNVHKESFLLSNSYSTACDFLSTVLLTKN